MRNFAPFILTIGVALLLGCSKPSGIKNLADMPIAVTNNAVCGVTINGEDYVYSFGGLSSGKTYKDITLRSFRLKISANMWEEIDPLPDTMGKIASAASVLKDKIYIVGGYHVFPDGHEKSSAKVHVYDPASNKYLEDAQDIPTPIDDQVQAIWKDSLLYVVSGWSDSLNVGLVQVYEPTQNVWQYGTSVPDVYSYSVFGSSGVIVGNELYFAGGAGNRKNKNFPIQSYVRIGRINPGNALEIVWNTTAIEAAGIYRPGAMAYSGQPAWLNGADLSYNYNGVAYTGPKVEPLAQLLVFDKATKTLRKAHLEVPRVMDLRGVASFEDYFVVAGGMLAQQRVSNKTFLTYIE